MIADFDREDAFLRGHPWSFLDVPGALEPRPPAGLCGAGVSPARRAYVGRARRPPIGRCGMVFEQFLRSRPRWRASHSLAEG